jgi:hypothetical protein
MQYKCGLQGYHTHLLLEAFTDLADELSYIWIYQNNSWVMLLR